MATQTASILFGGAHRFHGGLTSGRSISLYENDRPVWMFPEQAPENAVRLIPRSPERILADGLLLALQLGLDARGRELLVGMCGVDLVREGGVDLTEDTGYSAKRIDEAMTKLEYDGKMIVACFAGSSVLQQLHVLAPLTWDVEVLAPVFVRTTPAFGDGHSETFGSLTTPDDLEPES